MDRLVIISFMLASYSNRLVPSRNSVCLWFNYLSCHVLCYGRFIDDIEDVLNLT